MKFRCKMCDIVSIQHFYRILHTVSKLTDQNCIVRITPNRLYVFTKVDFMTGGQFMAAEIRPDMLFDEFQMSGYAEDANEIYVEVRADILMQSLKNPSEKAKFVKIKLSNKTGPCMSIEAELPSNAPSCRRTLFDVPVVIVHRLLWPELTPVLDMQFSATCFLPHFKIFKGVIDHMKAIGKDLEVALNHEGELKLHMGAVTDGFSINSHFQTLDVPEDGNIPSTVDERDEEEEEVLNSRGFFKVTVDIRQLSAFLTGLQFPTTRMRCEVRHRRYMQLTLGTDDFKLRYWMPSVDVGS